MTATTFSCTTVNDWDEFGFIAGSEQDFTFYLNESTSGSPIDCSTGTVVWVLFPYGKPSVTSASLNCVISGSSNNIATCTLTSDLSVDLYGKFQHQIVATDYLGSTYRPSQGIINIWPAGGNN